MDKYEILKAVEKIHQLSKKYSDYTEVAKKCTGKYCEITKWADEIEEEIKSIKKKIEKPYEELFFNDMNDKYLCRMSDSSDSTQYICIFHVTGVDRIWKSIYFKHDLLLIPTGECLRLRFDNTGQITYCEYMKETDSYDHCSGYLTSNHIYHLIPESINGWKEIDKDTYNNIMNIYKPKDKIDNIKETRKSFKDFKLNNQDNDSFLFEY